MSTTSDFIAAKFQVTMTQAHDFIMSHVSDPAYIYNLATQYQVTSAMLGEITGFTSTDVENFFSAHNLDGMALRGSTGTTTTPAPQLLSLDGLLIPDSVVKLDTWSGVLSTASLHAAIVAKTGQAAYDVAFGAAAYDGNHDGFLSASELGSSSLGSLPATEATIESLFFGTAVTALKSLDVAEMNDLSTFAQANSAALAAGDAATLQQMVSMVLTDISTPATDPMFSDTMLADLIVGSVSEMITMMGAGGNGSLFQSVLLV